MKKADPHRKIKLVYSGELLLFAILFLVFGILKMTKVMGYNETRRIVFNWITLFGSAWVITDLIWGLASKTRRQRICLLDKFLTLPVGLFIMAFDFVSLIAKPANDNFYIYSIGGVFLYISAIYFFQAIYHYFKPIPGLLEDEEDEQNIQNSQENQQNSEEKPIN